MMRKGIHANRRSMVFAVALCILVLMFLAMVPGCEENTPAGLRRVHENPNGQLVSRTECKLHAGTAVRTGAQPYQDCFEYDLKWDGTLLITHANAGFNCCLDTLTADITIRNDTITIAEHEGLQNPCLCLCLYDLSYRFQNIEARTYVIQFVEPLVMATDSPLRAAIDLSASPSGSFCVPRTSYPWDTGGGGPVGRLVSHTGCLNGSLSTNSDRVPTDLSCIEWHYDESSGLSLTHINAGFNCCPGDIGADISIVNDTITIVEREEKPDCNCECLYDLMFEIRNLEPRRYTIRVVEPYAQPGDERLEFSVDLASLPSGMKCAYRPHYPWMYQSTLAEDQAVLDRLRAAIVDFIGAPSCGDGGECRYIGLGVKPCGGPWEYIIYSTANVAPAELAFRVDRYNVFNYGLNRRYNLVSTCSIPAPPDPGCVEGICRDLNGK